MGLAEAMDLQKRLHLQRQENSKSLSHLTAEQVQRLLKHESCQQMYKTIGNILFTSSHGGISRIDIPASSTLDPFL